MLVDYEQLRNLAKVATPGPWVHGENYLIGYWVYQEGQNPERSPVADFANEDNAAFIAYARTALPALLDERDRLAAEVVALREALTRAEKHHHQRSGQRCYCGFSWPCPERPRIRALLDDPSPAVAEVLRLVERGRKAEAQGAEIDGQPCPCEVCVAQRSDRLGGE